MTLVVFIACFIGVSALIGGVAVMVMGSGDKEVEDRLDVLTGSRPGNLNKDGSSVTSILSHPLESTSGLFDDFVARFGNLNLLFEQADTSLTVSKFLSVSAGFGLAGAAAFAFTGLFVGLVPVMGILASVIPFVWVTFRRRRRFSAFAAQLPDGLELLARALRAGHSLAAGFNLVATELNEPISKEFGRVFEEQNLGLPLNDALEALTDRIPNLDLRFFSTAVILQRQTGGDLAEILDKIGHLVRERFKIKGQVQALTGEGRLSGVVLLALPPLLFLAVYKLNPDYVMPLFEDPLGHKMLFGGVVMQTLGALVIRKIVNIKV